MRVPRIAIAIVLAAAGLTLPAAGAPLREVPPGVIGMGHDEYEITGVPNSNEDAAGMPVVTIHAGDTLTFQNDSRWVHVVGPGTKGLLADHGMGAMTPRKLMPENTSFTTDPWIVPGEYLITCTVHPDMNAKVVVLP